MTLVVLLLAAAVLPAQTVQDVVRHGEDVFAKTCASGYCHAAKGAVAGGAPRLAARGFSQEYIANTVARGIAGTAMPAFGENLPPADMVAVIAYVATLNGIDRPSLPARLGAPAPAAAPLSPEATRGRELFSDATRGFGRCSTCHEVNGIGIPVSTAIAKIPADPAALKALTTPGVSSATIDGETMPILMIARRAQSVSFYDLTSVSPVLRTVAPASVQTRDGSNWRHASAIASYSETDLAAILAYLRAVTR
ncbi:MAG TPA: cytochrome c [Bryobacteraceae bacterium]|nr:cytochrome c [Bryobacteraceae bacterium]